jgi:hypothetical protein
MMAAPAYANGGHGGGGHGGGRGFSGGHGAHPAFHHFHHRGRVFVGVAPFFAFPYWDYPAYYYPPVVVQPDPPVYIQQQPGSQQYWYYCPSARAYYPNVPTCPEPWVPVPATTH